MRDMQEFIDLYLTPIAGDFEGDFDLEAIAAEVTDYDPKIGIVWRQDFLFEAATGCYDTLNEVFQRHEVRPAITFETVEEGDGVSLHRVSFDADGGRFDIAVLAYRGDVPRTTSDWQGEQPASIAECADFDWTDCREWLADPSTPAVAKTVVRAIIEELGA